MKFIRYRKPSLKTLLGITGAKRKIKKDLGVYEVTEVINAPKNFKRRVLNKVGYYSTPMKILRNGFPRPGGCLVSVILFLTILYRLINP